MEANSINMEEQFQARIDAEAIDLLASDAAGGPWTLLVRLGGFREAIDARLGNVHEVLGATDGVHAGAADAETLG